MELSMGEGIGRTLGGVVTVLVQVCTLAVTALLALITFWYANHTKHMAQSTAEQVKTAQRTALGDMLLRLNELYADKRTNEAIRFIYAFKRAQDRRPQAGGRYALGQVYYEQHKTGSEGDLHRWHLTNFWYTVAMLRKQGIIDDALIQDRFGSSLDVIDVLEPIEVVLSYQLRRARETVWPVWDLYSRYGDKAESKTIPVYNDEFAAWLKGCAR
jgi:hypothetical protein